MSLSVSTSDPVRGLAARLLAAASVALAAAATGAAADRPAELDRALARAFPPPLTVERRTALLDDEDLAQLERLAGTRPRSRIALYYVAVDPSSRRPGGRAFVDTHLVRTLPETLLIVLDGEGLISRIEVLEFREPREYLPGERWMAQFERRGLDDELWLRRGIRTLSGATLSSRSVTEAARRALALHALLEKKESSR